MGISNVNITQKMKFFTKDFFSKCDQNPCNVQVFVLATKCGRKIGFSQFASAKW